MFIAAVLAFTAGIYGGAVLPVPLALSLLGSILVLGIVPFIINRKTRIAWVLIIAGFALVGAMRITFTAATPAHIETKEMEQIYEGTITEASPYSKIVRLITPETLRGAKVMLKTGENLGIGDRVRILGTLKELNMTFRNPGLISMRWIRKLEGVSYELKGAIVSTAAGNDRIEAWRRFLASRIDESGSLHPDIIKALTIGDTTGITETTKNLFLRTGTSHILSISGSNITIVTAFFFLIVRMLLRISFPMRLRGDDRRYAALASIPFAVLFMITAGSGIPIIRATIMITAYMLGIYFERSRHVGNAVALSALLVLFIYPHSLFTPSCQLTFVSVIFIIIFTRVFFPLFQSLRPVPKWFLSSILVTVSAMLGTLPIVLYHFHGINFIAVVHNLIAVPLMCALATPLALLGVLIPYGDYLLRLTGQIINAAVLVLEYLNKGYLYPVVRPNLIETAGYYALLLSLLFVRRRIVNFSLAFILVPLLCICAISAVHERFYNKTVRFSFIDVGLGDALLVEAPLGMRMLIDGGGLRGTEFDVGKTVLTPILLSKKIMTLDYVINTHPHGDHTSGLAYVANHFDVKHVVLGTSAPGDPIYENLMKAVRRQNAVIETWRRGDLFSFENGLVIEVLHPPFGFALDNANNRSLVLLLRYGETSFLLTGDIDSTVEEDLLNNRSSIRADILKVPHHGSRYSSNPYFLKATSPRLAVLTTGPGIPGIPSEEALQRYRDISIPILRTDRQGLISITTDGKNLWYTTGE